MLRGWGSRAKLACGPGSRVPRSADPRPRQVPSRHRCHSQTACFLFFPDRFAEKLRAAAQPFLSITVITITLFVLPPTHPQARTTWSWRLGQTGQHFPSCFEAIVKLLDMLIFLPRNVHCYPYNHVLRNKLVRLAIKGDSLPPYHCMNGDAEVQRPEK